MKKAIKRSVGRPRTGKIKMIISVAPEIRDRIDNWAKKAGLTRSAYIEAIFNRDGLIG